MALPEGYYGAVAEKGETKREIPREDEMDQDADLQELPDALEIAPLQSKAQFDDFVVWGHESLADASADPYVRGIEEWVTFSEQVGSKTKPSGDIITETPKLTANPLDSLLSRFR